MGSTRLLCGAHLGAHRYKAGQLEMLHSNSAERTHGSLTGMTKMAVVTESLDAAIFGYNTNRMYWHIAYEP